MRLTGAITQWQSPMQSSVRLQFDLRMRENSWIGFFKLGSQQSRLSVTTMLGNMLKCDKHAHNVGKHAQM